MKKKIYKILIAFTLPVLLYFVVSGFKETGEIESTGLNIQTSPLITPTNEFIVSVYNADYYGIHNTPAQWSIIGNLPRYKNELNFNSIQIYGDFESQGGGFNDPLSTYDDGVDSMMNILDTTGLKILYGRGKITTLCYGQRLVYEAEGGNNGFSYHRQTSSIIPDNGRMVIHACLPNASNCPESDATPRFLCDSIYENLQHSNIIDDDFSEADAGDWFLKPEMKIKTSDFSSSDTTKVLAIFVKNFDGSEGDTIIIRVKNFGNNGNYSGNYIHDYYDGQLLMPLTISGNITDGLNKNRDNNNLNSCKIDFKIYWFGQVEVWFDKLIVDDEMGNNLFHANPDIRNIFETKVTEEIDAFRSSNLHPSNYTYYMDEIVYSNVPCIKKVVELMKSADTESRLSCATTNYLNTRGMRNDTLAYRVFFQSLNPELFTNDAHEIPGYFPDNLTLTHSQYNDVAISTSTSNYQTNLQDRFGDKFYHANDPEHGTLVYQVDLLRRQRDIYAIDAQLLMQPQNHGYLIKREGNNYWEGLREPTNEELQAQAMICIAHGANGICWLGYQSTINIRNPGTDVISYGLLDTLDGNGEAHPRIRNMFGQNKWAYVGNMNLKIKHWTPTLDLTKWKSGWSVHSEGATHEFIYDIKSIKRDPYHEYIEDAPCTYCDAPNEKYWEMGFFDPDFDNTNVSSTDKSKYFLMVNRRCVPDTPTSGQGDLRQLKIKFDSTQLTGFTNWKITDLDTNNVVAVFNKNTTSYIDMGIFQPGEGKLYKLAPVMQEGGTLVADESVSGSFDCKGLVNNGGKNITLIPGTTINFANSDARIIMNGGNFKSGINTGDNTAPVNLQGKDTLWKGIVLQDCPSVEMYKTYFKDFSPYEIFVTKAATKTHLSRI